MRSWSHDPDLTSFFNLVLWILCMQLPAAPFDLHLGVEIFWLGGTLFDERNISITTSHKSRAGIPSIRKPASSEIVSDSAER